MSWFNNITIAIRILQNIQLNIDLDGYYYKLKIYIFLTHILYRFINKKY